MSSKLSCASCIVVMFALVVAVLEVWYDTLGICVAVAVAVAVVLSLVEAALVLTQTRTGRRLVRDATLDRHHRGR